MIEFDLRKSALKRFGRGLASYVIAAAMAYALAEYAVTMNDLGLSAFTGIAAAGLLSLDKALRSKGVYGASE